eukprot:scaffold297195_cov18-Tisochrysis_lutea.AAC.3
MMSKVKRFAQDSWQQKVTVTGAAPIRRMLSVLANNRLARQQIAASSALWIFCSLLLCIAAHAKGHMLHFTTRCYASKQMYDVAVWFVAHPRQQQAWTGGAPDMYCISGSANFVNKADNVIM